MNQARIDRTVEIMRQRDLRQIIITSTASVYYLTGLWVEPMERMLALLLTDSGEISLYGNCMLGLPEDFPIPLYLHSDGENPVGDLAAALGPGKVGIDKFWYSKFLLALMAERPDIVPVEGSVPVDQARKLKDGLEVDAMRRSSRINDQVMAEAIGALREGVRENELASYINQTFLGHGADCEGIQLVCFGENGADPHHAPCGDILKPGDSVVLDIFTPIDRYWCDMTRTVFYQSVSDEQRLVYNLVRNANEAAIAAVKPGIPLSHLDNIARGIIEDGGYGPYFTHRLGHGCGIDCHEPPDVSGGSHDPLEPGMIFSIEPGIYLPGKFGVRIEDLVLVTDSGCEVLNGYTKDLQIIE